jgi:hypothetical protein
LKTDIALQNAVNLKKLPEKELNNVKAVVNITFQIISDDYITYTSVVCPKCDYKGYAPKLPFLLKNNQDHDELIKTLLKDSSLYQQKAKQGTGGSRRPRIPIFGLFILLWILPLIAFATFVGWALLYLLFAF